MLDTSAQPDARGKSFVRFAVDERYEGDEAEWQQNAIIGCVYLEQKQVFFQRAADYVPASAALGRDVKPQTQVCRSAPGSS